MRPEKRWLDDEASPQVRRLLESAVVDEATDAEYNAVQARLTALFLAPLAAPSAKAAVGTKAVLAKVVATATIFTVGAAVWLTRPSDVAEVMPTVSLPPSAALAARFAVDAGAPAIEGAPVPTARAAPKRVLGTKPDPHEKPTPAPSPPHSAKEDEELDGLQAAMSEPLPITRLALIEQHRQRYPQSTLGQEREILAVEALVALGRKSEAEDRAAQFRQRWPTSSLLVRLNALVGSQ
jgi:hypothetical protein